ncbi:MAG: hypothetical protein LC775_10770 [Acidobacteria bacterium]|nr:hypothetical protein [Acidobacteriota bacterium]
MLESRQQRARARGMRAAREQRAGRGRQGRSWPSPPGKRLLGARIGRHGVSGSTPWDQAAACACLSE